jgi:TolB-like protein/class 3 adenylate cyclase/Flp pilus assembly protein TadD
MTDERSSSAKLEIAHVLLIDIVGYSKLLIDDQQAVVRELSAVVRGSTEFRAADEAGKLVRLPTGDGIALIFFTTPEAPVRCALEIARGLRGRDPSLQVRMGIHSGPVTYVKDVDEGTNVAGAGINLAQRVMDCGDAGHILLSHRVAEDIGQFREWLPHLHDIGECGVKHEVRVHLFNLYSADFGNPAVPSKVEAATAAASKLRWSRFSRWAAAAVLILVALVLGGWFWHSRLNVASDKSIAVLPFENFSDDKANAFFADGIQDDILTSLAKIHDLRVISRTSVEPYRGRKDSRSLHEIAKALGVANVLEGSVRREKDRMVVNVQLIDALQDRHLWANRYDRTLGDSLGIQGELAQEIADALRATLTPEEKARVGRKPTDNPQAYELYLQARQYEFKPDTFLQDYRTAEQLYVQAITLDPNFALAHARLAATCARIYHFYEPTDTWKKRARAEAEIALQLQPNLGEAHHALGRCYYWFDRDYTDALRELSIAKMLLPNDGAVPWDIAAIKRRQGRWQETVADYHQILRVDPQNANVIRDLLYVYCAMRDWPNGEGTAQRLIALTPDSLNAKAQIGYVELWARGSTARLKSEMATVPPGKDPDGAVTAFRIDASMIDRDTAAAERALLTSPLDTFSYFNGVDTPRSFFAGEIALLRGDNATARAELEHARDLFAAYAKEAPDVAERHAFLGLVCALLGDKQRAISEGMRAVELRPESQDALDGAVFNAVLALIYARVGDNDRALVLLQHLLAVPGAVDSAGYSITLNDLKLRWEWDPLRNDPRFQRLVAQEHQ